MPQRDSLVGFEPPLSLSPEIVIPSASLRKTAATLQSSCSLPVVLLPESFRGGCSFGTALKRLLPTGRAHYRCSMPFGKGRMSKPARFLSHRRHGLTSFNDRSFRWGRGRRIRLAGAPRKRATLYRANLSLPGRDRRLRPVAAYIAAEDVCLWSEHQCRPLSRGSWRRRLRDR